MKCRKCNGNHDGSFGSGQFCNRSCANSRIQTPKINKQRSEKMKGKRIGNVIITFMGYEKRKCTICNGKFDVKVANHRKTCGSKCTLILIKRNIKGKVGGYRENSVRGKHIKYKKKDGEIVKLQSTYEEIVAKELDKNNIQWLRPSYFTYDENRKYYPDFYLIDYDVYLDPKNSFLIKTDSDKIDKVCKQNNIIVIILDKENLLWENIESKIKMVS